MGMLGGNIHRKDEDLQEELKSGLEGKVKQMRNCSSTVRYVFLISTDAQQTQQRLNSNGVRNACVLKPPILQKASCSKSLACTWHPLKQMEPSAVGKRETSSKAVLSWRIIQSVLKVIVTQDLQGETSIKDALTGRSVSPVRQPSMHAASQTPSRCLTNSAPGAATVQRGVPSSAAEGPRTQGVCPTESDAYRGSVSNALLLTASACFVRGTVIHRTRLLQPTDRATEHG